MRNTEKHKHKGSGDRNIRRKELQTKINRKTNWKKY
jgi:hypothetical protein